MMARSTLSGTWSGMKSRLAPKLRNLRPSDPVVDEIFAIACGPISASLKGVIETAPPRPSPPLTPHLTTSRGVALYIGALLGPGLLLLPGLAVTVAGPASLLAWVALLALSALFAVVFAAFGLRLPSAGGGIGYVTAGLGPRAGLWRAGPSWPGWSPARRSSA